MRNYISLRIVLCVAVLFSEVALTNGQEKYTVASISPEMMKNADAVIRLKETSLTINSPSSATYKIREVVTILNENAREMSTYLGFEDKFISSDFGKITIYDKEGKKVKNFGSGELKPTTNYSGSNIFDDDSYRVVDPEYMTYPFTAEITYSMDFRGIFTLPDWKYYQTYNVSTEKSVFSVTAPEGYKLRYYEQRLNDEVSIIKNDDKVTYKWEAREVPAVKREPLSVSLDRFSPAVILAPSEFVYAGYAGKSDTWYNYGQFISQLNKGRNALEGETVEKVKRVVASTTDTVEIIKQLYRFMQNKTRYVSVQIGIGGWQPIMAQKVDNTSYGDCKALSNYMKSLLDLAGIKSNYTLVKAGDYSDDMITTFPSNQFNHAILLVPEKTDTIWLECTSQKMPFNYLGSFTDDRGVLMVTDSSGVQVKTPKYSAAQNKQSRKAIVTLDHAGNASASVSTDYNYFFFDENIKYLYYDHEDQKKALNRSIDIPGFILTDFSIKQDNPDQPSINEDLSLNLAKYATMMGDRILVPLNLMNRSGRLPSNIAERKMDIELKRDLTYIDSITYKIPLGYSIASTPQPIDYNSPFGHYTAVVEVNGSEITYIRQMRYNKGVFPVSQYPQLLEFNKSIATADNAKIALKRL